MSHYYRLVRLGLCMLALSMGVGMLGILNQAFAQGEAANIPEPYLVADINATTWPSEPRNFLAAAGTNFFVADDGVHGRELWKTDGTVTDTVMVRDIFTGPPGSGISNLTAFQGKLYFTAEDPTTGYELWTSDGTAAGTMLFKEIVPGIGGGHPADIVEFDGRLYFRAISPSYVAQVWRTDGTPAGTEQVTAFSLYYTDAFIGGLTAYGDALYFSAAEAAFGHELWRSDGTLTGTVMVADIYSGTASSDPSQLTVHQGRLYFRANDGVHGYELWQTDGAPGGTGLVADMLPGNASAFPSSLTSAGDTLYFLANIYPWNPPTTLWRSDGTLTGTTMVTEAVGGLHNLLAWQDDIVYFEDAWPETRLWRTSGNPVSTLLLKTWSYLTTFELAPNAQPATIDTSPTAHATYELGLANASVAPFHAVILDGQLMFTAGDGYDRELWRSDGTPAGTALVADIYFGPLSSFPEQLSVLGDRLFFSALDANHDREPWISDGTPAGTSLLADVNGISHASDPDKLFAASDGIYFSADDGVWGREPWKTDGTAGGTLMLADVAAGPYGSSYDGAADLGSLRVFNANGQLWRSNGTPAGTEIVRPDVSLSWSSPMAVVSGIAYFRAYSFTTGVELWRSDGTPAGTYLVKDIHAGGNGSWPEQLVVAGGRLYFTAEADGTGRELWRSDGTEAGTHLVKDILAGNNWNGPQQLTAFGERVAFALDDGIHGNELWVSDGTPSGTHMVKELRPGTNDPGLGNLTDFHGTLLFTANSAPTTAGLWRSDGTADGTTLVHAFANSGWGSAHARRVAGEWLFLAGPTDSGDTELWASRGSQANTSVLDVVPGWQSSHPAELTLCGNALYFTADGGWSQGREIWQSDGTPNGTEPVTDLVPPGGWGAPSQLTCWDGKLFFVHNDGQHGTELWALPAAAWPNRPPTAVADSATTPEDTPVTLHVLNNDIELDLDVLHVAYVGDPGHGTATIQAGRRVIYTPTLNYFGSDSFVVTIADEHGSQSTAQVSITITAVNDAPIANNDIAYTQQGKPVIIMVLSNDSDVEMEPLQVTSVSVPAHGAVELSSTSVTYTPPDDFLGIDTFTYTISDGELTASATVMVHVTETPMYEMYLPLIRR